MEAKNEIPDRSTPIKRIEKLIEMIDVMANTLWFRKHDDENEPLVEQVENLTFLLAKEHMFLLSHKSISGPFFSDSGFPEIGSWKADVDIFTNGSDEKGDAGSFSEIKEEKGWLITNGISPTDGNYEYLKKNFGDCRIRYDNKSDSLFVSDNARDFLLVRSENTGTDYCRLFAFDRGKKWWRFQKEGNYFSVEISKHERSYYDSCLKNTKSEGYDDFPTKLACCCPKFLEAIEVSSLKDRELERVIIKIAKIFQHGRDYVTARSVYGIAKEITDIINHCTLSKKVKDLIIETSGILLGSADSYLKILINEGGENANTNNTKEK